MKTAYVYDTVFVELNRNGHPEDKKRLESVIKLLEKREILDKLIKVECRIADDSELMTCHSKEYVATVKDTVSLSPGNLDVDTYFNRYSYEAAVKAAGRSSIH